MDLDDGISQALSHEQAAESDVLYRTARASQLRRRPAIRSADRDFGPTLRDTVAEVPDEVIAKSAVLPNIKAFQIRCGSGQSRSSMQSSHKPYPLPLLPTSLKRKYSESFSQSTSGETWSNGCGQLLDSKAYPLISLGAWSSVQPQHVAVVDDTYANCLSAEENVRNLGALFCGCVRQLFGCTTCGNIVGTVVRLCTAHFVSSPMSSRDFPVRQGVHLFFPTRVTPTPDYPFPPSSTVAQSSRTESSGSNGVRDRPPAVRRRRLGRVADSSPFAHDGRGSAPPRAQRTAEEMRSLYDDFYYNDNDHLGMDDLDTGRTPRSRTPQGDEDTEAARDRGENGFAGWMARYRSPHPPPQQRPRSPSVLSTTSSAEILGGEPLFPFPRSISGSLDRDRGGGGVFDDGNPSSGSGAGGLVDDREYASNSGPVRRSLSGRAFDEQGVFRQQQQSDRPGHSSTSSSTLPRRRTGTSADDPPGNRSSTLRSLTIQAAPPLFSDVRRRRSVSDALLPRGDRSAGDENGRAETATTGAAATRFASAQESSLTLQLPTSLPMTRRRSRGRGSSGAETPPLINRSGSVNGGTGMGSPTGVVSSLVPILHVPPHLSPRDWVFSFQEHIQDGDGDSGRLSLLDGRGVDQNSPTENTNVTQPSDGEIATGANDDSSRLVLGELDCDGEIA